MKSLLHVPQLIYLDEFGTSSRKFNAKGVTNYYIIAGLIFDASKKEDIEISIKSILKNFNIQGELKSSNLKHNPSKRIQILTELSKLDIFYLGIAIDKRNIYDDSGLQWNRIFIKYTSSLLFSLLGRYYQTASVYLDKQGTDEFMESFQAYIVKKETDLFSDDKPHHLDSKDSISIQVADFIAGTLGYIYDEKYRSEHSKAFNDAIQDKILFIEEWPPNCEYIFKQKSIVSEYDDIVKAYAERQAKRFLDKYGDAPDRQLQIATLKYLLYKKKIELEDDYIFSDNIIKYLKERFDVENLTRQYLSNNVISKLRDADVIISSCSKGYKIPSSYQDLIDYVEQINNKVLPMLSRLNNARDQFLVITKKELDIVKDSNQLIKLLDCQKA